MRACYGLCLLYKVKGSNASDYNKMMGTQVALQRNGSTKILSPQQLVDCSTQNKGW